MSVSWSIYKEHDLAYQSKDPVIDTDLVEYISPYHVNDLLDDLNHVGSDNEGIIWTTQAIVQCRQENGNPGSASEFR